MGSNVGVVPRNPGRLEWTRASSRRPNGFTFVELALIVVIVGLIMAIAIPIYSKFTARAKEGSVVANAHTLRLQVESVDIIHGRPPESHAHMLDYMGAIIDIPPNPFTGEPTVIGPVGAYSKGDLGYAMDPVTEIFTVEGYGANAGAGPNGDGIVITLEAF